MVVRLVRRWQIGGGVKGKAPVMNSYTFKITLENGDCMFMTVEAKDGGRAYAIVSKRYRTPQSIVLQMITKKGH